MAHLPFKVFCIVGQKKLPSMVNVGIQVLKFARFQKQASLVWHSPFCHVVRMGKGEVLA